MGDKDNVNVDELAARAAELQLESAASRSPLSTGLRLQILNPFERGVASDADCWPEPESRMMNLQADMEAILDQLNLTDLAFQHKQRRLVKYLAAAFAPPGFKAVINTKLTFKFDVVTASDSVLTAGEDRGTIEAVVEGVPVKALLLDSGADTSLVAHGILDSIGLAGKPVAVRTIHPVRLSPVGGREVVVQRMATFIVLTTSTSPLMLRNLACFVEEANSRMELMVGRPIMKILGYSTDKLQVEVQDVQAGWELGGDNSPKVDKDLSSPTSLQRICRLAAQDQGPDAEEEDIDRHETRTALPCMQPTKLAEVTRYLEAKVEIATRMGLTPPSVGAFYRCERIHFGSSSATPHLSAHTSALMKHGLIYKNNRSRWASAPRIVKKKGQADDPLADPHMTIDTRGVERTEPMPWPMPVLEFVIDELEGTKVFFVLDWFRGY
ncbi:unnamed protein product [Phytophthora fragariaefolia]|uniref:Unnamed protein product n=1 Tax=Phytophthora fragariaefolia TaxID=1490495 RepID=A0A9W6XIA8_9STRA|nr:unnamed protein product [Phytophthora fragariaefolia]